MLPLGFCSFLVFGMLLVLVGASHSDLTTSLGFDLEEVGLVGACVSLGLGTGVIAAGPLVDRFPRRPVYCAAALLGGLALCSVDASMSFPRAMLHVAVAGIGAGVFETLLNTVVVEQYGEHASRPVTFLHSAATLGAVVGPPLVALLASVGGFVAGFRATGLFMLALAVWGLVAGFLAPRPPDTRASSEEPGARESLRLGDPILLGLCAISFAYIGVEAGLTLFAVPFATGVLHESPASGQTAISIFWLGLLLGRLALLFSRREFRARLFVVSGVGGALVLLIATGLQLGGMALWYGLCGLILAGVFPALVTLAGRHFKAARGTAIGLTVGAGSFGGFVIPFAMGVGAEAFGVRSAVAALALACLFAAAVALPMARAQHPAADAQPT